MCKINCSGGCIEFAPDEHLEYLKTEMQAKYEALEDPDGVDVAFYHAAFSLLDNLGDGGISESYIAGIKHVLKELQL